MEKYARQAINDGVTSTEELSITRDCELYRALNMHYNKANDFEVGTDLCFCVCVSRSVGQAAFKIMCLFIVAMTSGIRAFHIPE